MPWVHHASPEINAASQFPTIIAVSLSLTTLMTGVILARGYVRTVIVKALGSDDYVTASATIISMIYNGLAIWQTRLGLGLPVAARPVSELAKYSVINFAGRSLYMLGVTGYKVALCLAYLRLVGPTMKPFRKAVYIVMGLVITSHLASTLVIILQCRPVEKSWKPWLSGVCLANYPTWNATAAITIVCDVVTFLLPVPMLARLQMDRKRKIGIILVFTLGLFTTVCSVMRMLQIKQIARDGNNSNLVLWGTAELNVGIALSCVPSLEASSPKPASLISSLRVRQGFVFLHDKRQHARKVADITKGPWDCIEVCR